jgi:MraZ protein
LSEFSEENRQIRLNFFSGIATVELDVNGRFLIPKNLQVYAALQKEVVLIGMQSMIAVWDPNLFDKHLLKDQKEYSKLMQKLDK